MSDPWLAQLRCAGTYIIVVNDDFRDSALVLVGHGSTVNANSSGPVYQHAAELRRRNLFVQVRECFWMMEPRIAGIVDGLSSRRTFVVPLCISEGYFTEEVIPRELGLVGTGQANFARVQQRGKQTVYYCQPIGTHPGMTEVLLGRAREVVERHPFPHAPKPSELALFICGHGTSQNENSRKAIDRQVELIRSRHQYREVHSAFLEENPRIGDCYRVAQARNIVVVPFFMSAGLHSVEDIPVFLGESKQDVQKRLQTGQPTWRNPTERSGKRLWYATSIGNEPLIADVILERVKESMK